MKSLDERLRVLSREKRQILDLHETYIPSVRGAIGRSDRESILPASYAQEQLWFLDQLEPGTATYNISISLSLEGPLSVEALERALDELMRRHEGLRTCFVNIDGRPWQSLAPVLKL